MDGDLERLKRRFERQLQETAELAAQLQAAGRQGSEPLHYSTIELAAHEAGRRLSQRIQSRVVAEAAVEGLREAACPSCGAKCATEACQREMTSIDGRVAITESRAYCDRCRRAFFPSA